MLNPLMSDPSYAFVPDGFAGRITLIPGLTDFRRTDRGGIPGPADHCSGIHIRRDARFLIADGIP